MTTFMHCRPYCGNNISICSSSFLFARPDYITTSNYQTYTPSPYHYHDQTPPPIIPRRRRRLEDPITTYASNYYATFPQVQLPPSPHAPPPPLPPPRRICQQSDRNDVYCDLFNLLERPSPPSPPILKPRRKYNCNDFSSGRQHHPTEFEDVHTKLKNTNEQKHHHHHHYHQSCYYKEKKRQDDRLSSTEQYDRSPEKTKKMNDRYQRRSLNKGFFRRVVRNYFCIPSTIANNGYSS
jgi:hypothetical protein